jgi:iron complex transport system ATP-binding protein
MIELQDVRGGYHGRTVVEGATLPFPRGQITTIIGPNGCGKSTLIQMACGLLAPYSGRVLLRGQDLYALPRKEIAKAVSYLPQSRGVAGTAAGTLVLHGRFPHLGYPRVYRAEDIKAAQTAMETLGVWHLRRQPLAALSGGERQNVYLAMLWAQDTDAVFLDEPTTYLDIAHQLEIMRLVGRLKADNKAVVMALHDINHALTYSDRVVIMENGKSLTAATPEEALESRAIEQAFGVRIFTHEEPGLGKQFFFTKPDR